MSMSSGSRSIPEVVQSFGHKGIDCISYVLVQAMGVKIAHRVIKAYKLVHVSMRTCLTFSGVEPSKIVSIIATVAKQRVFHSNQGV